MPAQLNTQILQQPFSVALRPKVSPALRVACSLAAVMPLLAVAEPTTVDGHGSSARTNLKPNYSIGAGLGKSAATP
jgi:hypothetical protein